MQPDETKDLHPRRENGNNDCVAHTAKHGNRYRYAEVVDVARHRIGNVGTRTTRPPGLLGLRSCRDNLDQRTRNASAGPNRVIRRGARGARILHVRGQASSKIRLVPVNPLPLPLPLPLDGEHYLVAPRGETQCVRNIRAAGSAELRRGRTLESIVVAEVIDTDKAPISRAYLELWAMKIGKFFDGLTKDSSDTEINAAAPGFPVFRITPST